MAEAHAGGHARKAMAESALCGVQPLFARGLVQTRAPEALGFAWTFGVVPGVGPHDFHHLGVLGIVACRVGRAAVCVWHGDGVGRTRDRIAIGTVRGPYHSHWMKYARF